MRKLTAMCLLAAAAAACTSSTGPDSPAISIRLLDDAGAPAGRNQIIVTQADGTKLISSTGTNGKVNINVAAAGEYVVSVIERNAFVGSDALTRRVSVTPNSKTVLEFILYRKGVSTFDPPEYGGY